MLLAMVAISGAGALTSLSLLKTADITLGIDALIAVILSFFSGWAAIALMMKFLEKFTFRAFAIYRLLLGGLLLGLLYSGTIA